MLTIEQLNQSFDERTLRQGITYANNRQALSVDVNCPSKDEIILTGKVEGSQFQKYSVIAKINKITHFVEATCTCSVGYNCKHAVALIVSYQNNLIKDDIIKPISLNASIDYSIENWLDSGRKYFLEENKKSEKIFFILKLIKTHNGVYAAIFPQIATLLKRGGFGKLKYFYPYNEQQFSKLTKEETNSFAVLDFFLKDKNIYKEPYVLDTDHCDLIFDSIIATGECYWENLKEKPLTFGKSLKTEIHWKMDAEGNQFLAATKLPENVLVIPTRPLFYINLERSKIGRIEHNFPNNMVKFFIECPVIPPEQARIVRDQLSKKIKAKLPLPKTFERVEIKITKPIPHLYINTCSKNEYIIAKLSFDYLGVRLNFDTFQKFVTQVHENVIWQIPRDFKMEQQYIRSLVETYNLHRFSNIYGLSEYERDEKITLQDTFLISKIVDREELQFFQDKIAPKLNKEGWIIEFAENQLFQKVANIESWYTELAEKNQGEQIDWFGLELGVIVEGKRIDLLPLLLKALQKSQLIYEDKDNILLSVPNTGLIPIPKERMEIIMQTLSDVSVYNEKNNNYEIKLSKYKVGLLNEIEKKFKSSELQRFGNKNLLDLTDKLGNFTKINDIQIPENFAAKLRPYQQVGINWLQFLREYNLGGILADDMGLGKTIQTLAHLSIENTQKRLIKTSLVIAPTSVIYNWASEIEQFSPYLSFILWHGDKRKENEKKLNNVKIILTNYPLLVRDKDIFLSKEYYYIILDEAQTIKNTQAKMTQIAQQLKGEYRLCLTGTPLENHLGELWSQFNFLMPDLLGSQKTFLSKYRTPIEKYKNKDAQAQLSRLIKPFMLRRTKQEVIDELPDKTEIIQTIELAKDQKDLYETIRLAMNQQIQKAIDAKGIARSQIVILDALLKLRQICCHPQLLKIETAQKIQSSAKLDALMELIIELVAEKRKILLFSQFTSMLSIIEVALVEQGIKFVRLTGSTKDRSTPINKFQSGDASVFLISLKAGGTGLNLTAADTVIHYDPWWNPSVENQATDRAHRIGQTQKVFVYKLICKNTVEEKILQLQEKKRALVDAIFSEGTHRGSIEPEDLKILLEE